MKNINTQLSQHVYSSERYDQTVFSSPVGMASLYCTVTLSIIRLFIIKNGDNFWLEGSRLSCKIFVLIMMIWTMAMAIAIPPAIGFGKIGQDMVGIR